LASVISLSGGIMIGADLQPSLQGDSGVFGDAPVQRYLCLLGSYKGNSG